MTDQQDPHDAQYERVRDVFEELAIEDRTRFLIQETVNTISAGVDDAARSLAAAFDHFFGTPPAEAPASPAKKSTSTRKSAGTAAKKTTGRKTSARKTTTRKKSTKTSTKKSPGSASGGAA